MTAERRTSPIVLSIEAAAQQWARQEGAPAGSALTVGREVAGRLRGGVEWRGGAAVAVVARPATLGPTESDLAWLAAGLGAVDALAACSQRARCEWPDRVVDGAGGASTLLHTSAVTLLGPGRVDVAILVARIVEPDPDPRLIDALVDGLRSASQLLDEPSRLSEHYGRRCRTIGRSVSVRLLPHGSCSGVVRSIKTDGSIELTTPTDMVEIVAVGQLDRLVER